jgi:hypothetical protein
METIPEANQISPLLFALLYSLPLPSFTLLQENGGQIFLICAFGERAAAAVVGELKQRKEKGKKMVKMIPRRLAIPS